ncbi:DUF4249 domain-containing protein [Flavobacteriaceae bacterium F89]|uniref:DUF4249 domain-containing protein n=1 Tax=Cerina litoralis TaxID=2874477 RepID=A0AAE3EU09_9FLAO|nr:DUF4249 family protein [Cerina litoralis]MCG2461067.1 DUF4249 domain-containing protein [Cerina litoralis]
MRNFSICIFCILLLSGCQKVVDVDLPTTDPRLIIDATFSTFFDSGKKNVEGAVKLSLTASFYSKELPPVNDATVYMTDMDTGDIVIFSESDNPGIYIPPVLSNFPVPNKTYKLSVIYKNETYEGTATMIPTVPIDSLSQGDVTLLNDETEIIVSFTDEENRSDFYLFDLDFNLFLTTYDQFYQGQKFTFSYFYEDIEPGKEITVKINGVDEQFYNYMNIVISQSGQNDVGPFPTPPAAVRGNMVNITNPDNYPLGYFAISEAYKMSLIIE